MKLTIGLLSASAWFVVNCSPINAGIIHFQAFDTEASAAATGWTGFGNSQNGNLFGFSGSDNTGGLSPAGEAGGTIARTENLAYYADGTLGGVLTFDDSITATGEFDILSAAGFNNANRVGYFDSTDTTGAFDFLGFQVAEPQVGNNLRVLADVVFSNGATLAQSTTPFTITPNGDYTWEFSWSPSTNLLRVEFFDSAGVSVGESSRTLSATQRAFGISLNAFGLTTGGIGEPISPNNNADVFIDNLSYTTAFVPEPASQALLFSGVLSALGLCVLRYRRQWCRPRVG